MPWKHLVVCGCLFWPPLPAIAHPNDSIVPERPKPTPYGFQISRVKDLQQRSVGPWDLDDGTGTGLPVADYLRVVQGREREGGAYDTQLVEPLHDLGRAYQAGGRHDEALATFRRALHLNRINGGLYNSAQLPLMNDMIDSYLVLGDLDAADQLYDWRFRVQQQAHSPGQPEMQQAVSEYVDWQRQAYLQGITGVTDEGFRRLLTIYEAHSAQIEQLEEAGDRGAAYREALYNRLEVEYLISQYDGEKVPAVQLNISGWGGTTDELATSTSIEAERFRQLREYNLRNGINTARRIVDLEDSAEQPDPVARARARLAAGDWYQWWGLTARARQNYEEAWAIFDGDESETTDPDDLFSRPVELPDTRVFHPDGIAPSEDARARAVVSLRVSRDGRAREIEVVEQEPPEDMGARVVLYRLLRDVRFRPVVRNGQTQSVAGVVREYRYQY
ncbi:tetratricopeptide repeat protein [Parahaliea mediterranea]|uniref:Tetratricopeptide repeat protein n=1 Tax=Parahaliea mediterranea TaxID=651086 RepID=A0A939DJB8_9GAMM|nr:tetratricopeptide repeat protein [Parahaliea mediterranea]MBN7799018.1 tetratricopeptide repeat protein [Parahaliea mediterranea]